VPYDMQKGRMTSRIIIPDEKILQSVRSNDAKEALVSTICR
jgi:predicted cupin superfamily sugar epimerase